MLNNESFVNNLNSLDVAPVVDDPQAMESALQDSGELIRKKLGDAFLGYLESAEHIYLRKCDVQRVTGSLDRYAVWLTTIKISPRTGRRMCAFYLALKVTRVDILATVCVLYLRNVSATSLQKVIKLDADKENGVDTGQFVRSEYTQEGILLYFGPDESPYDLAKLTSRQIDSLAFPEKAAKASSSPVNSEKSQSAGNAEADTSAALEVADGKDQEILQLRLHCEELEQTILELKTELAAHHDTVPRAQYDELKRKFTLHLQHTASEKKKLLADAERDVDGVDVGNGTVGDFDEDEQDITDVNFSAGYVNGLENSFAA